MELSQCSNRLLEWYRRVARDLPWRRTRDPYRILVSEVMLQQTRVAAVIPYYERFLERFPSPEALANAPEPDLLAAWSGLGYYSRARNLQKAATRIVALGSFPEDYSTIRDLPGVGDYTAAAVASIAFRLPLPAVDGNVLRVVARLTDNRADIKKTSSIDRFRQVAALLVDPVEPGDSNQALMELGATVCLPRDPQCLLCPLADFCRSRAAGTQTLLPVRSRPQQPVAISETLLIVRQRDTLLLWRRPADSPRMAGFWELPRLAELPHARLGSPIGAFRHSITVYRYSFVVQAAELDHDPPSKMEWVDLARIGEIPLSTITRKALRLAGRHGLFTLL